MNSTEQKPQERERMPKLLLTQPLQFQKLKNTESLGRHGIVSIKTTQNSSVDQTFLRRGESKEKYMNVSMDHNG